MTAFRSEVNQAATFFRWDDPNQAAFRSALKNALAEHKLTLAADTVREQHRIFHVPYARNLHFTGRETALRTLRARLTDPAARTRIAALTGLGGIGKTQTALEYAYRYAEDYRYVFWLRAEDPVTLATDYAELATAIALDVVKGEERDRIRAVRDWLDVHDDWLSYTTTCPVSRRWPTTVPGWAADTSS